MKNILICSLLLLTACSRSGAVVENMYDLPPELADCKFYRLTDMQGSQSLMARCDNSTTSTKKIDSKLPEIIMVDQPSSAVAAVSSVDTTVITKSLVPEIYYCPNDFVGPVQPIIIKSPKSIKHLIVEHIKPISSVEETVPISAVSITKPLRKQNNYPQG